MAKNKRDLTQYYRWQFLRLNEEYHREYELFMKELVEINNNSNVTEIEKQKIKAENEDHFYNKYGINGIYDYRLKNPPSELRIYGEADFAVQKGSLETIFNGKLKDKQLINGHYLIETRYRKEIAEVWEGRKQETEVPYVVPKCVQVVINYDAKLGDIKLEVEKMLKRNQELRRKILGIKRPRKLSKEPAEYYDNYLKAYCLTAIKKISNKTIAKKIFPQQDSRAAEDKAIKYVKRAIALIHDEYKTINL